MHMREWIAKLDDFLEVSDRDTLTHTGEVSHEVAALKAEAECAGFERRVLAEPTVAEKDLEEGVRRIERLPPGRTRRKPEGSEG